MNVTSQSDLDGISGCSTYKGDITVTGLSGDATLNGVKELNGDLTLNNVTSLNAFAAPSLQTIDGAFTINVATVLSTLNFPELSSVGSINWVTLPAISGLTFGTGVTEADSVVISDTGLNSLDGINIGKCATFNINNNRYLSDVSVALTQVTNSLDISFNSQSVQATFDSLEWANNITFQDVQSISLQNLTKVNASLGFINNTIQGLSLPQLTEIGGSLAVVSNSKLTNASFPLLKTVGGGLQIANNTQLTSIMGFPKVNSVGGAIQIIGNFSSASLPSLNLVKGGVDIESSSDKFNCSSWNSAHSDGDIQGDSYVCKAKSSSTSVAITSTASGHVFGSAAASTSAAESGSSSSSKKNGAAGLPVVESFSLVGAVGAFLLQFV